MAGRGFYGERTGSAEAELHQAVVAYAGDLRVHAVRPREGDGLVIVSGRTRTARVLPASAASFDFDTSDGAWHLEFDSGRMVGELSAPGLVSASLIPVRSQPEAGTRAFANISTRGGVEAGDSMLIGGFVVKGTGRRNLLVRAVGPALEPMGVAGVLARPVIEVRDAGGRMLLGNAGWGVDALVAEMTARAGAFEIDPDSPDAALVIELPAGSYTAQVRGLDGDSGVALVEIYDAQPDLAEGARLINISTRGIVDGEGRLLIAGFVVSGSEPRLVLVRGVGPTLTGYGLADALPDPEIAVFGASDVPVRANDDWADAGPGIAELTREVGAFPLATGSRDAALAMWLAPGQYTVHVRSADGGSGVALAEIYEVP
ncbi:MAG: hypothetical protein D6781_09530 [Verrucomicrobia bacterium]|nr:MAG: hypothetical protein D6781_09530 [Verrucomicrobiota bacterium]